MAKHFLIARIKENLTFIDDGIVTESDLNARIERINYILGFDLFGETDFQHGVAHRAYSAIPDGPRYGPSMKDAWSGFQAVIERLKGKKNLMLVEEIVDADILSNAVTFGSPHSNYVSRSSLGYHLETEGNELIPAPLMHGRSRIVFLDKNPNSSVEEDVKRASELSYTEGNWLLQIEGSDKKIDLVAPRLNSSRELLEDFLVISNVPNMSSSLTRRCLDARMQLGFLLKAKVNRESDEYHRRIRELELASSEKNLKRVLIVGGLHGPGTSAARAIFGNDRRISRLISAVKDAGLEGKSWQALYKVNSVKRILMPSKKLRDVPELDTVDLTPSVYPFDN